MRQNKTQANDASVAEFLNALTDAQVRADCRAIVRLMQAATGARPRMWGGHIIGFGEHRSFYTGGRERVWMLTGFSPRKHDLAIYIMDGFDRHRALLARLGPHKHRVACLYVKRLSDIHLPTLKKLITASVRERKRSSARPTAE